MISPKGNEYNLKIHLWDHPGIDHIFRWSKCRGAGLVGYRKSDNAKYQLVRIDCDEDRDIEQEEDKDN